MEEKLRSLQLFFVILTVASCEELGMICFGR